MCFRSQTFAILQRGTDLAVYQLTLKSVIYVAGQQPRDLAVLARGQTRRSGPDHGQHHAADLDQFQKSPKRPNQNRT